MNASEAVTKIKLLLGLDTEVTTSTTVKFATATLVDGTEVSVEGEFEEGKACFVETEEEKLPMASGVYQTEDNLLITVDEAGVITSVEELEEEVKEEEITAEEEVKEEVEVAMEDETVVEEEEAMEDEVTKEADVIAIAQEVVTALKPYIEGIDELKEKVAEMEAKFNTFAKAPAAKPIKKVSEDFEANKIDRVAKIAKLRK